MERSGFTLVELLSVFTITAIILLMAIPNITSMLKKGNEQEYQRFLKDISVACEAYVQDNEIIIDEEESVKITVRDLINSKFLKSTLINPDNGKKVLDNDNLNKQITIKKDVDGALECNLER